MTRLFLLPVLIIFAGCTASKKQALDFQSVTFAKQPKNIILLIGDGMALSQVSAGLYCE